MAKDDDDDRGWEIELDRSAAKQFRGIVAIINYLGQDRSQIQFAAEELRRSMAKPKEKHKRKFKTPARFLKGNPRYINHHHYQQTTARTVAWPDTDSAGCNKGRESTSGGMMLHGATSLSRGEPTRAE